MTAKQKEAALDLATMMLMLARGHNVLHQRSWQDQWNKNAQELEGMAPVYPKKLVR